MSKHVVNYVINNEFHQTRVAVIGAGGTGSQVLTYLARLNIALLKQGRPGIHVDIYDSDVVTEYNVGRQMFLPCDIGSNKAHALATRINRSYGFTWDSYACNFHFDNSNQYTDIPYNVYITCVDTIWFRLHMEKSIDFIKRRKTVDTRGVPAYWIDAGNNKYTGQVICGTISLPEFKKNVESKRKLLRVAEIHDYSKIVEDKDQPSCSMIEALEGQSLFVNAQMALCVGIILEQMFIQGVLSIHGMYVDVLNGTITPLKLN